MLYILSSYWLTNKQPQFLSCLNILLSLIISILCSTHSSILSQCIYFNVVCVLFLFFHFFSLMCCVHCCFLFLFTWVFAVTRYVHASCARSLFTAAPRSLHFEATVSFSCRCLSNLRVLNVLLSFGSEVKSVFCVTSKE